MSQEYSGVLAFCNDVREKLGRQPLPRLRKGIMGDPTWCVVAGTINYRSRNLVTADSMTVDLPVTLDLDHPVPIDVPAAVGAFINAFDGEELPELEGSGWVEDRSLIA